MLSLSPQKIPINSRKGFFICLFKNIGSESMTVCGCVYLGNLIQELNLRGIFML